MRNRAGALAVLAAVLLAGGCQKLNVEKTITLDPIDIHEIDVDPPAYQQKVTVTITPTSGPVSAYLCTEANKQVVKNALGRDKAPPADKVLGSRESKGGPEAYTFEATVPAKTAYSLLLKGGGKKTEAKIKLTGR
jgi:hypothetical protein